jgi:hypothetical protein
LLTGLVICCSGSDQVVITARSYNGPDTIVSRVVGQDTIRLSISGNIATLVCPCELAAGPDTMLHATLGGITYKVIVNVGSVAATIYPICSDADTTVTLEVGPDTMTVVVSDDTATIDISSCETFVGPDTMLYAVIDGDTCLLAVEKLQTP